MSLEYKPSFQLNSQENRAFQDYLNKTGCGLNAVVPVLIREFLMNKQDPISEDTVFKQDYENRLSQIENKIITMSQRHCCCIEKVEKIEEYVAVIQGDVNDIWTKLA